MSRQQDVSDLVFRFEVRDLAIRAIPDESEASLPIAMACPICSNLLQSVKETVKGCKILKDSCIDFKDSEVCVNLISLTKPKEPPKCACNTIVAHPTRDEPCGEKTKCNRKSVCGQTRQCGKCTQMATVCHCTENPDTKACDPKKGDSCNKTEPWCMGDNTQCKENNVTNGCGCTKFACTNECTNACTNAETKAPAPVSPGSKPGTTTNENLVALLREDLIARLSMEK